MKETPIKVSFLLLRVQGRSSNKVTTEKKHLQEQSVEQAHHDLWDTRIMNGNISSEIASQRFLSSQMRHLPKNNRTLFVWLKRHGWKYYSLISCERKTLFVDWKSMAYKPNEQGVTPGKWRPVPPSRHQLPRSLFEFPNPQLSARHVDMHRFLHERLHPRSSGLHNPSWSHAHANKFPRPSRSNQCNLKPKGWVN
jgi:hypothetical protein